MDERFGAARRFTGRDANHRHSETLTGACGVPDGLVPAFRRILGTLQ